MLSIRCPQILTPKYSCLQFTLCLCNVFTSYLILEATTYVYWLLCNKFSSDLIFGIFFQAYTVGRALTQKLKELIPRQMFKIPIQVSFICLVLTYFLQYISIASLGRRSWETVSCGQGCLTCFTYFWQPISRKNINQILCQ